MNMLKQITIICLLTILFNSCIGQSEERFFLNKYENEDFSKFKGIGIFKRGGEKNNEILGMYISYYVNDESRTGFYVVTLSKKNHDVIKAHWRSKYYVDTDTIKLQQLSQEFMKFKTPHLSVDTIGNVFVYLKDFETLALVRFVDETELKKRSKETKWRNIKGNWYKPKR